MTLDILQDEDNYQVKKSVQKRNWRKYFKSFVTNYLPVGAVAVDNVRKAKQQVTAGR